MAKMGHKMVALCATAIGVIYSAGYVITGPSVSALALAQNSPASIASSQTTPNMQAKSSAKPNTQTADNSSTSSPTAPSTPDNSTSTSASASASSTTSTQGAYRNGTYSGSGSNRIGAVEVAVTVDQGKIISCEITNCSTHYSVSAIDPVLPNEVVARQSGNVDVVSGATRSTEDFQTAVQQALDQAKA